MKSLLAFLSIIILLFNICTNQSFGQLTIYSENFDGLATGLISQTTPTGGWLASSTAGQLTDGYFNSDGFTCYNSTYCVRNVWTIYNGGTSPMSAISGKSAGISGWDGNTLMGQFDYWVEAATTRWIKHSLSFTGYKDMNLAFKWKCLGESSGSTAIDYGSVHLSTNNGSTWTTINTGGNGNTGKYYGLTSAQNASLDLSTTYNNAASVLLAFKWTSNDNSNGSGPTFIIDNIVVTGCPLGGTVSPLSTSFTTSGSTTLTCSGVVSGASYQWQSAPAASGPWTDIAGATSASYTTPLLTTTTYYRCKVYAGTCDPSYQNSPAVVTITSGGCTPAFVLSQPADQAVCENSVALFEITASGTTPVSYQWQVSSDAGLTWNNVSSAQNAALTFLPSFSMSGNLYRCIVANACGADTSDFAFLTVYDAPGVFAGNDTLIEPGSVASLYADAFGGQYPYTYSWLPVSDLSNPDSSVTIASPVVTTSYTVFVTGANGCIGSDVVVVNVNSTADLIIPNVFTPNNDNINDQFEIVAEGVQQLKVTIFNRWGKQIVSFDGMTSSWDGKTSSGEMSADGTYFYIVEATDLEGKVSYYQGSVALFAN
ncbi:hypothetical protein SDC9_66668 [bioreactor metagenome]|uniref:Ig-like domain-containing protein n=1 Tax=bioreactor metagenome TaxID=1076179 RepID=A0A644XVX6_9ZZZZ